MRTGSTVPAFVLASDGDTLMVAVVPKGQIVAVPKRDVFDVRVVLTPPVQHFYLPDTHEAPAETRPEPPPAPLPPSTRYFGMHLGIPPAVMVDIDYGHFLGFANVSILMPFLTEGTEESGAPFGGFGTSHLWAFTVGAGATFPFAPSSRWRFDLFAIAEGSNWSSNTSFAETYGAFGLGMGFHVTLDQGFSFGVKGPLVGGATGTSGGSASALTTFFVSSLVGLPLVSFGYRF
jgi:hypothetical protein